MNKIKTYVGAAVLASMMGGSVHAGSEFLYDLSGFAHPVLVTVDLGLDIHSMIQEDGFNALVSMDTVNTLGIASIHYGLLGTYYEEVYNTSMGDGVMHALNAAALVKSWSDGRVMDSLLAHNAITHLLIKDVNPGDIEPGNIWSKAGRLVLWAGAVYDIGSEYGYSLKGMIEDPHILHTSLANYLILDDRFFVKHGSIVDHLMGRSDSDADDGSAPPDSSKIITNPEEICDHYNIKEEAMASRDWNLVRDMYDDEVTSVDMRSGEERKKDADEIVDWYSENGVTQEAFVDYDSETDGECKVNQGQAQYEGLIEQSYIVTKLVMNNEKIVKVHFTNLLPERVFLLKEKIEQGGNIEIHIVGIEETLTVDAKHLIITEGDEGLLVDDLLLKGVLTNREGEVVGITTQ